MTIKTHIEDPIILTEAFYEQARMSIITCFFHRGIVPERFHLEFREFDNTEKWRLLICFSYKRRLCCCNKLIVPFRELISPSGGTNILVDEFMGENNLEEDLAKRDEIYGSLPRSLDKYCELYERGVTKWNTSSLTTVSTLKSSESISDINSAEAVRKHQPAGLR